MKIVYLGVALALAGCAGSTGGTAGGTTGSTGLYTKDQLKTLPVTTNMPTGSATYTGKLDLRNTAGGGTESFTSDLNLAANFSAASVQATASNFQSTFVDSSGTLISNTTGSVTGPGVILGSGFTIATMTGPITATSSTLNGVAQPSVVTTVPFNIGQINGNFVGDAAAGIYGSGTTTANGGNGTRATTYEIYGNKQ